MAIVSSGASVEYDIPINTRFEVSTLGEAYVDALSGPIATGGESVRVMPGREYRRGPYTVPCRVRVRCISGSAVYGLAVERQPVFFETSPGGGIGLSAGGAPVPLPLRAAGLAFIGDSRAWYGRKSWYYAAAAGAGTAGLRFVPAGTGPAAGLSGTLGNGLLEWRTADASMRWTAPGDTPGPWTSMGRRGECKLESGSAGQWLRGYWLGDDVGLSDRSFAVQTTGNKRPETAFTGTSSYVMSELRRHSAGAAYLGVSGAHVPDCLAMLQWYSEAASGDGVDVIRCGANDITAQSRSVSEIVAAAYALFGARRAQGRQLVICGEPARWGVAAGTAMTAEQLATLKAINAAYRDYADAHYSDTRYVDLWAISADPAYSDGRPVAGLLSDHVHDAIGGVVAFGSAIVAAVRSLGIRTEHAPDVRESLFAVSAMDGTAGTAGAGTTGVVPTGWTVRRFSGSTATMVSSVVGFPEKLGNRVNVEITAGVGSNTAWIETGNVSLATMGVEVGEAVEIYADFEVVSGAVLSASVFALYAESGLRCDLTLPTTVGRYAARGVPVERLAADTQVKIVVYLNITPDSTAVVRVGDLIIKKAAAI